MFACPHAGVMGVGFYRTSGRSFRTAPTTSTMAALVACESLRSYTTDVCVAPFTTRWMLLDERVASLSCSSSQVGSACLGALTTASGLFPRLPGLPSLRVWVGARNSPALALTPRVEGLSE